MSVCGKRRKAAAVPDPGYILHVPRLIRQDISSITRVLLDCWMFRSGHIESHESGDPIIRRWPPNKPIWTTLLLNTCTAAPSHPILFQSNHSITSCLPHTGHTCLSPGYLTDQSGVRAAVTSLLLVGLHNPRVPFFQCRGKTYCCSSVYSYPYCTAPAFEFGLELDLDAVSPPIILPVPILPPLITHLTTLKLSSSAPKLHKLQLRQLVS